jgi:endoglucanase
MKRPNTKSVLRDLLALPTAPLNEGHVVDYIRRWAAERPAITLTQDEVGNIVLRLKRGAGRREPMVLAAHMDHPGFEARRMVGPQRLEAAWLGWVHPDYFKDARVRFYGNGRWIRGTVRAVEVGMVRGRRRVKKAEIEVARDVAPGSIGMWDLPDPVVRGERIYARGCDDVAGVAAILDALDEVSHSPKPFNVMGLLTRAEEIGFAGAIAACRAGTIPKNARIVAVETSSEIPGVRMGEGPILRVGDLGSIFSPGLTAFCRLVAGDLAKKDKSFRFQRKLMDGGTCESTVYYARGYDATGLCVGLGNYHNMDTHRKRLAPEYIHLDDYRGLVKWFVALATTRRPYDTYCDDVDAMIARLERVQAPQLRRTAGRVRRVEE